MAFKEGQWVIVTVQKGTSQEKKFKGFIEFSNAYDSVVNVWVPAANTFNPHRYRNEAIEEYPLEVFDNQKDLYIEGALLLNCKNTFMEAFEDGNQIK